MDIHLNRRRKYQISIFLILLLFSFVVAGVFTLFQYDREKDFKTAMLDAELQVINNEALSDIIRCGDPFKGTQRILEEHPSVRLSVIDLRGNVLFDSYTSRPDTLSNHLMRDEVSKAIRYGSSHTVQRVSETGTAFFYSATCRDGYVVRSALPYGVTLREFLKIDKSFLWVMAVVLVVMTIVSYVLSRVISRTVTDQGEKEKLDLRREMTNNINHELKTPVSAIKAYLETVISVPDIDREQAVHFVCKAYAQTERLNRLLQDLSVITRLEEAGHMYKREPVVINDIVEDLKAYLEVLPADKRMRFNTNISSSIVVTGDPTLLNSVFRNLLENAIAYSGGTDIWLNVLSMDRNKVEFSFADNGVGVDSQHLEQIFQRFYRVDKGRSRKVGGTGLGLSIVKNAVLYHNGEIRARERKGGGLEFVFTLSR